MLDDVRFYAAAAVYVPVIKVLEGAIAVFDCLFGTSDDA